jgi:hypothetical protein
VAGQGASLVTIRTFGRRVEMQIVTSGLSG